MGYDITSQVFNDISAAKKFRDENKSENTLRAYSCQWSYYANYCEVNHIDPFQSSAIAAYIGYLSTTKETNKGTMSRTRGKSISMINQVIAAIRYHFHCEGLAFDSAPFLDILSGIRRYDAERKKTGKNERDRRGVRQVKALTLEELSVMVEAIAHDAATPDIKKQRDIAIILCGFSGAFRRSELADICREDITEIKYNGERCYQIELTHSKTDQFGMGQFKTLFPNNSNLCPVKALDRWLKIAKMASWYRGYVFPAIYKGGNITQEKITGQAIANVIKHAAALGQLDIDVAGHSLRRGFVTTAFELGASDNDIMTQTGHKTLSMLQRYKESRNSIEHNAARIVFKEDR